MLDLNQSTMYPFNFGRIVLIALLIGNTSCAESQPVEPAPKPTISAATLPIRIDSGSLKPLIECSDVQLQRALEQAFAKKPSWQQLAANNKMAVGVVDLRDVNNVKYAAINGDLMLYAASLPKIAVLLAAMDAIEKKEIEDNPTLRADLRLMISHSDNAATTRVIDLLGFEKIASVMQDPKYLFYNEDAGGGLWVGKRYAPTGPRIPEPLKGISHAATVDQVCRFYYNMAYGQLVTPQRSAEMLALMEDPDLHHKFVNTIERIAPNARLFRKSGTWSTFHADSILVWGDPNRRYILVALIDDKNGEQIMRQLVEPIEKAMKSAGNPITAQASGL